MRDASPEQGIAPSLLIVHVGVEVVPRQRGKAFDIVHGHLALRGPQGVSQLKLIERNAERMRSRIALTAAAHPAAARDGNALRRSLYRGALHVVQYAANPTHLLAAAGAPGPAVDQRRKRRPMPGRFFGAVAIHDQYSSVVGSQPQHE